MTKASKNELVKNKRKSCFDDFSGTNDMFKSGFNCWLG